MTGVLYAIARFCTRRRFVVLAVWLLAAAALVAVSHRLGDNTNDNLTQPGTGSQRASDALSKSFPDQANGSSPIVLHVPNGKLTDSKYSGAVNEAAADVAKAPHVASVVNPLTSQGAGALSKDQATGYRSVTLSESPGALSVSDAQTIIDAASKPAQAAGIVGPNAECQARHLHPLAAGDDPPDSRVDEARVLRLLDGGRPSGDRESSERSACRGTGAEAVHAVRATTDGGAVAGVAEADRREGAGELHQVRG
jgi:MMPL family